MRLPLLLPAFALALCAAAQDDHTAVVTAKEGHEYALTSDVILSECLINGDSVAHGERLCPYGAKFTLVGKKDATTFILSFFDWYDRRTLDSAARTGERLDPDRVAKAWRYNYVRQRSGEETDRYFLIDQAQVGTYARELTSFFNPTYGAIVLPIRYRPQTGLMTKDLSLGGVGGIRHRFSQGLSLALITGLAITSTTLDSASTNGRKLKAEERGTATLPLGLLVQWDNVQFGVMAGWDLLFNNNDAGWRYQGKPWLSLGIGLSLFSEDTGLRAATKTN